MATYKEIFGTNIQVVSSDPANPVEGQIWYNTTTQTLKGESATTAGSWATGGALNTNRIGVGGSGSTVDTSLAFGGSLVPGPRTGITESYNGTSWTEVNDMNLGRSNLGSTGTQTASLAISGAQAASTDPEVESWNGTSWTEIADVNTARENGAGHGTQTAALFSGGQSPSTFTESWNGTSWTEVNDLNTGHFQHAGVGSQPAALVFGGNPDIANTESYNGTSWTEVNDMNTGKDQVMGFGTQTSAIAAGGNPTTAAESWNGTSWTNENALNNAKRQGGSSSGVDNTSGLIFGGIGGNVTEEWTGAGAPQTVTITTS